MMLQRLRAWLSEKFNREFFVKSRSTTAAKLEEVTAEVQSSQSRFERELHQWEMAMRRKQ